VAGAATHTEVAREELTTRCQVARAFADCTHEARDGDHRPRRLSPDEAHHRRRGDLATVVSDLDRRCVVEVLDGRDRHTVGRSLAAFPAEVRAGMRSSRSIPYYGYRQAIRAALPHAGSSAIAATSCAAPTRGSTAVRRERQRQTRARRPKGVPRSRQHAAWRHELYRAATDCSRRANASATVSTGDWSTCSSATRSSLRSGA
jgi:transposase